MKKYLICFSFVLCILLLSTVAFADTQVADFNSLKSALTAAGSDTVNITGEITVSSSITISGDKTLTGNGTVKRASTFTGAVFSVPSGASLYIGSSTDLVFDGNNVANATSYIVNSGTITVLSGNFINTGTKTFDIHVNGNGTFNTGGKIGLSKNGVRLDSSRTINLVDDFEINDYPFVINSWDGYGTQLISESQTGLIGRNYYKFSMHGDIQRNSVQWNGQIGPGRVYHLPYSYYGEYFSTLDNMMKIGGFNYDNVMIFLAPGIYPHDVTVDKSCTIVGSKENIDNNLYGMSRITGNVTVASGVDVTFKNISFPSESTVSGEATFEDCTFGPVGTDITVTYDGKYIRVYSPKKMEGKLLLGLYDSKGMLEEVRIIDGNATPGLSKTKNVLEELVPSKMVRAFFWSDLGSIRPVSVNDTSVLPDPTIMPKPTATPEPSGSDEPTPTPAPTPTPTPTPTPVPEGKPVLENMYKLTGSVIFEARNAGYVINETNNDNRPTDSAVYNNFRAGDYPSGREAKNAFDGNISSYCQSYPNDDAAPWVGLEFDTPVAISAILYHPRNDYYWTRICGGMFQGANNRDFSDAVTLYTVPTQALGAIQGWNRADISETQTFKYVRYLSTPDSYSAGGGLCNIAEIEFYALNQ